MCQTAMPVCVAALILCRQCPQQACMRRIHRKMRDQFLSDQSFAVNSARLGYEIRLTGGRSRGPAGLAHYRRPRTHRRDPAVRVSQVRTYHGKRLRRCRPRRGRSVPNIRLTASVGADPASQPTAPNTPRTPAARPSRPMAPASRHWRACRTVVRCDHTWILPCRRL